MRVNSKKEFALWLIDRRQMAVSQETIDLIDLIGDVYLGKANDRDTTPAEVEAIFFGKMRTIYTDFCYNVLETAPVYDASDAKALKEIISFLRKVVEGSNKRRGSYEEPYAVDLRVLDAWQMILSKEFFLSLPDSIKMWTRLRQLSPKMMTILNIIRAKMKDSVSAVEIKKKKDEIALRDLLQMGGM